MRRYRRFSLRTLIVLMTVVTLYLGITANRANRQRRAVEAISALGGHLRYDYQLQTIGAGDFSMRSYDRDAAAPIPAWLEDIVSEHYFITPVELHLYDRQLVDAGKLGLLAELPGLEEITFSDMQFRGATQLQGADLAALPPLANLRTIHIESSYLPSQRKLTDFSFLRGFPRLRELSLAFSSFGDDDAEHVSQLIELRSLHLKNTPLGDEGLRQLADLKSLVRLSLGSTQVTDAGLVTLSNFSKLRQLDLSKTDVTDDGIAVLRHLPELRMLNLNWTGITDAGLAQLQGTHKLDSLSLVGTTVSDASLEQLKSLTSLTDLNIAGAQISEAAAAELHAALPNCHIQVAWGHWLRPARFTKSTPARRGAP